MKRTIALTLSAGLALALLSTGTSASDRRCVHNQVGGGYVAKVAWYKPSQVERHDPPKDGKVLTINGTAAATKKIAIGQSTCSPEPMVAVVATTGGKVANDIIKAYVDVNLEVGAAGTCAIAGWEEGGAGCTALEAGAEGLIDVFDAAFPSAKTVFYMGIPAEDYCLNVYGTVWAPKFKTSTHTVESNCKKKHSSSEKHKGHHK